MSRFAKIFFAVTLISFSANATEPEDLAIALHNSIVSGDYVEAAALFDPEELESFRQLLRYMYEDASDSDRRQLSRLFGQDATPDSVSKLSDAEFFAAFLGLVMQGLDQNLGVEIGDIEILGVVSESSDRVHVMTRTVVSAEAGEIRTIDVVSMRRAGDQWLVLMKGELKNLANIWNASSQSR